MQILKS